MAQYQQILLHESACVRTDHAGPIHLHFIAPFRLRTGIPSGRDLSYFFNCIYIIHGVFVIQDPTGNFVVRARIFHHDPSSSRVFPARHRSTSLSLQSGKLR